MNPQREWSIRSCNIQLQCLHRQKVPNGLFVKDFGSYLFNDCFGVQMVYSVVLTSGTQQNESIIYIHISTLFQIIFPYRSLQSIDYISLCYTVGSYQLSILLIYIVMGIFYPNLAIQPSFPHSPCNHTFSKNLPEKSVSDKYIK